MKKNILAGVSFLLLFFLGVTCSDYGAEHQGEHEHEAHLHLMEQLRKYQSPIHYEELNTANLDSSGLLIVHASIPAVADFFTEKRIENITSFPCANCHSQPLTTMQANRDSNIRKAHWDIHMVHAEETTMNCTTCHAKDNMNSLVSLTGKMIKLDESFKLCGQCHSTQYKDWQGGAHGKQLNGWKPPRVAKTCVSCHNPHQPAFPKRYPARLNTNQLGE